MGKKEEDLARELADGANKYFKGSGKFIKILGDEDDSKVSEWVSTGCETLNLAIANRPNGGWPVGRICEIAGLEASGKTNLAAQAIVETQRKGGLSVFIDTECAVSKEFFYAIGVRRDELMFTDELNTIEDVFKFIEYLIQDQRRKDSARLITIVVDSIMGASTKAEEEGGYGKEGYGTQKAILISQAMRKITPLIKKERICLLLINQLREVIGASPFADKYKTSGGKSIAFHASVRLRLNQIKKLKGSKGEVIGVRVKAKVNKNKVGPPFKEAEYDILFTSGIDDAGSWFDYLKDTPLISRSGSWYTFTSKINPEGSIQFQSKEFEEKVLSNPAWKEELYKVMCEKSITLYDTQDEEE